MRFDYLVAQLSQIIFNTSDRVDKGLPIEEFVPKWGQSALDAEVAQETALETKAKALVGAFGGPKRK